MPEKDYYKILGVARNASAEDIKKAFRALAKKYTIPAARGDKEAEAKMIDINEANAVLSDPERRKDYDGARVSQRPQPRGARPSGARAPGGAGVTPPNIGDFLGAPGDLSDVYKTIFGVGMGAAAPHVPRGGATASRPRGAPGQATVEVTLEEAFRGVTRSVSVNGRTVEVRVPPGTRDGAVISASNDRVQVAVLPHATFRLEGEDLHAELPITPWEAVLGAQVNVSTLDGRIKMVIPKGSDSGRRFKVRGKGWRKTAQGRGDLYVKLKIVVPTSPTSEEERLLEQWAQISRFHPRAE